LLCGVEILKCTLHTPWIHISVPLSGNRIYAHERIIERESTEFIEHSLHAFSHFGRSCNYIRRKAVEKCLEIETRSANEDRDACIGNLVNQSTCCLRILSSRVVGFGITDCIAYMGNAMQFLERRSRCTDPHSTYSLPGISAHDGNIEVFTEIKGKL
jgi:hypothetical protein